LSRLASAKRTCEANRFRTVERIRPALSLEFTDTKRGREVAHNQQLTRLMLTDALIAHHCETRETGLKCFAQSSLGHCCQILANNWIA
jgi:hypothetical protein